MSKVTYDNTEVPRGNGGIFFKRPNGKFWIRLYPFKKSDGSEVIGKHIISHWVDKVRTDCTGDGCELCKQDVPQSHKKRVAMVLRKEGAAKGSPLEPKMLLWDMPMTVWDQVMSFAKENDSSLEIGGDKGVTFAIEFDNAKPPVSKYSVSASLADKEALKMDNELLPYNYQKEVVNIEPQVSGEEREQMIKDLVPEDDVFA